jgi:general secretion pathway protein G
VLGGTPTERPPVTQSNRKRPNGFTLIELLIVALVLAILATLVVPKFIPQGVPAKTMLARTHIEQLVGALKKYHHDIGQYPTTRQGLAALAVKPADAPTSWHGPYLREVPLDPWNEPYIYASPGDVNPRAFDLLTYGADNKAGGEGESADVLSWRK